MRQLARILALMCFLTLVGTCWFWLVEGWSLLEAVYMTVITLSTVGFQEVRPLSSSGRVFVIIFLIAGLGAFLYGVVQLGEMVVRAELRHWWRKRGMQATIKALHGHYIVCGYGRMGQAVCRHLAGRGLIFVVIDSNSLVATECELKGWPVVCGDATNDDVLRAAGIESSRGLAAVLSDDRDNLYVVLSARLLVPGLQIIARAMDENAAAKMEKAGASRVVSLYATGAATLAQLLANPHVEDFFELVSPSGSAVDLAEIKVTAESPYANRPLSQTDFRRHGIIIVAVRRPDGETLLPPPAATVVRPDDALVALGKVAAISEFLALDAKAKGTERS